MHHSLLIIDDEPNIRVSLQESLSSDKCRVLTAPTAKAGIDLVRRERPSAVLIDLRLPDMFGLDAFDRIREIDARLPVIVMTAYAKTDTAIEATRRGAYDYLIKPVDFGKLQRTVQGALELSRLNSVPALIDEQQEDAPPDADRIVGMSPAMQEVYKTIGRVASQDATVLILGESGTGKELVARAVHHYSRRNQAPFLAINCAALPDSLLESELFGHEKGAFTGADHRRIGKFEQVNGGTIFLDEIGDMNPATQAKALRLLQQQQFERVGGNVTIQTDVRIIAATNSDLAAAVESGRFRRDLFYRLNGFTISLPPLRERKEDLSMLAEHFVKRFARELNKPVRSIAAEAMESLRRHDWPGNVREFESAVRYAMLHAPGDVLTIDCFPESCRKPLSPLGASPAAVATDVPRPSTPPMQDSASSTFDVQSLVNRLLIEHSTNVYREVGNAVDEVVLNAVLRHANGNQQLAAEYLGISRMTLRAKLRALGRLPDRNEA